jgi:hypothetical protein
MGGDKIFVADHMLGNGRVAKLIVLVRPDTFKHRGDKTFHES